MSWRSRPGPQRIGESQTCPHCVVDRLRKPKKYACRRHNYAYRKWYEGIGKAMETGEIAAAVVREALMANDLEILNKLSKIIKDQLEPRYVGYKMAEKLCKSKIFLDGAIRRAGKSRKMQNTLAGVVNETIDLKSLFSVSNMLKAFSKS